MLVIVAPLYIPLVDRLDLGIDDQMVWFGVLYTMTCQIAYITPPFGYNLFLMRALAPKEITLVDIYRSIWPFVIMMVVIIVLVDDLPADRAVAAALHLRKVKRPERNEFFAATTKTSKRESKDMTIKKKTDLAADRILASRRSMLRNIGVGTAAVAAPRWPRLPSCGPRLRSSGGCRPIRVPRSVRM